MHRDFDRLGLPEGVRKIALSFSTVQYCTLNAGSQFSRSLRSKLFFDAYSATKHDAGAAQFRTVIWWKRRGKAFSCFSLLIRLYFRQLYA